MKAALLYNVSLKNHADEKDTLEQVHFIQKILMDLGYTADIIGCTLDLETLRQTLEQKKYAFIFNNVESLNDSGHLILLVPFLIESLHLPMTGASALAIALTSDKIKTKQFLKACHLPTPNWYEMNQPIDEKKFFPKTMILKPIGEDASIGLDDDSIITCKNLADLQSAIKKRQKKFQLDFFAEEYIDGREFNVSILEMNGQPVVLPIAEMQFIHDPPHPKILTYRAKWDEQAEEYLNSQRSFKFSKQDHSLLEKIKQFSIDCWHEFQLSGYARVDFRVDKNGNPFILEINTNPSLSPNAGFMAAAQQKKLTAHDAIKILIENCL